MNLRFEMGAEPGEGVGVAGAGHHVQQIVAAVVGQVAHQRGVHSAHQSLLKNLTKFQPKEKERKVDN